MGKPLLNNQLVFIHPTVSGREDLLKMMATALIQAGCAKEGFDEAVLRREREYPTGLPTHEIGIALPHADASFVRAPGVCVAILDNPITFGRMDNPSLEVQANIVIMLALNAPDAQVTMLQRLAEKMTDVSFWEALCRETVVEEVVGRLSLVLY